MSSSKFFVKNDLQDNHWVEHLVTKPIDDVVFQSGMATREEKDAPSAKF